MQSRKTFCQIVFIVSMIFAMHVFLELRIGSSQNSKNYHDFVFRRKYFAKTKSFNVSRNDKNLNYRQQPVRMKNEIDLALVINLDHRTDRWQSISKLFRSMNVPFERIPAVNPRNATELIHDCFDTRACPGQVGCQLSHIRALQKAIQLQLNTVAIFEDDFILQPFVDPTYFNEFIHNTTLFVPNWDVIALGLNIQSETVMKSFEVDFSSSYSARLSRINEAQTTTGYILRKSIISEVLSKFNECDVKKDYNTAIDQCWKTLQSQYVWIGFEPQPGTQDKSFSDIEMTFVDYNIVR